MPGSALSVSGPNIVLNTAVAEALRQFYEELKDVPADKMEEAVHELVKRAILKHKKIIFNGNGYTDEWIEEAEKRGLYNLKSTPDALPAFIEKKNIELFTSHNIFTETEIHSRYEILLENYGKTIHIEAKTLRDMVQCQFLPALMKYTDKLAASIHSKRTVADLPCAAEVKLLTKLSSAYDELFILTEKLEADTLTAESMTDVLETAKFYHKTILADMDTLRTLADETETYLPDDILPYPSYDELLFTV